MDLNLLKTFYEVASHLSFTEASKRLFITQPAVTSQIKSLEESLGGINLFKKIGRKIFLTNEGKILLKYAENLVRTEREIQHIFADLSQGIRGNITIGATSVMGTYFLPVILGKFKMKYPFIEIKTVINNSGVTIDNVKNGKVDIAIAGLCKNKIKTLITKPFHTEKMVFIAYKNCSLLEFNEVFPEHLENIPFIAREKGTVTREIADKWLKEHNLYKNISLELGNVEAVKRMVEEGFGITIIPEIAVSREVNSGYLSILNVKKNDLKVNYYLIYPQDILSTKVIKVFIEFLLNEDLNDKKNKV